MRAREEPLITLVVEWCCCTAPPAPAPAPVPAPAPDPVIVDDDASGVFVGVGVEVAEDVVVATVVFCADSEPNTTSTLDIIDSTALNWNVISPNYKQRERE